MKKQLLTTLLLATAIALPIAAGPIDATQALQLAQKHINAPVRLNSTRAQIKARGLKGGQTSTPAYYLFNNATGKGFAIVAADSRLGHNGIIGYSTTGHLQTDSVMPPALQALLDDYAQAAEAIRYDSISLPPTYNQPIKDKVDPLLTCEWNQDAPYNLYTPIKQGVHCPIGCVAAAMSQVLYFHKWPKERPKGTQRGDDAYGLDYYDWDAMLPNYSHYTDHQASAVATLTRDVGQAVGMTYGPQGSWSDEYKAWMAFENKYGYSVRYIEKDVMPVGEYLQTIYHELSEGYPVFVTGGDHAFVYDGYDEDGLIHANWGWGGQHTGFYDINTVSISGNPYTKGKFYYKQSALLTRPKDGKHELFSEQPIILMIGNSTGLTLKESSAPANGTFTAEILEVSAHNLAQGEDLAYTGEVGVGLFNEQGDCLHIFHSPYGPLVFSTYYSIVNFNVSNNPWLLHFDELKTPLADGRYYLRPMCHRQLNAKNDEWESWRIMYNANTVGLTLKNNLITPDAAITHAQISLAESPEVLVPPVQYSGNMAAIALKVKNSTHIDARAKIKVTFKGKGALEGEVYEVPEAQLQNLYLAQRNTTSSWTITYGSSYSTSTGSGIMKVGKYSMDVEATYPEGDDYFEDGVKYVTQTLTWPDFELEVLPMDYTQGELIITGLTLYADDSSSAKKIFTPHEVQQIGFGIQTNISAMRDNWVDTQVRYRIKDLSNGNWPFTSDPVRVRIPYGYADLRNETRVNLPLANLATNHNYEVHVEVERNGAWQDLWNANTPRRQFSIATTHPVAGAKGVVGGFTSADYQVITQAYDKYATNPTTENYNALSQLITNTPRIELAEKVIYRLRNRYADNGTLYLTAHAEGTHLYGQTLGFNDKLQTFTLLPGTEEGTWHIYNIGQQRYVGQLPAAGEQVPLVDEANQAADYVLNTSLSTYVTTLTAQHPINDSYAAICLGKRNVIQAWALGNESAQWYVEPTGEHIDEGDITAIAPPVQTTVAKQQYYDLQGRRIKQLPRHGIVISTNGNKVVR